MGFDAGFYILPKYKNISYSEIKMIERVLEYETNSWVREHYSSVEKWMEYYEYKNFVMPESEIMDFYRSKLFTDEYGHRHFYRAIGYWCSNGSGDIYKWFANKFPESIDCGIRVQLTHEDIVEFLQFCWEKYSASASQPCNLKNAFRYIESEDCDEPEIRLIPCDGIEVEFEEGGLRRIEACGEYEFLAPKEYYNDWTMSGYIVGIEACIEILKTVDFENFIVLYEGGW